MDALACENSIDTPMSPTTPTDTEKRRTALFIMRVTDELSLGHSGVNCLCSATQSFVESIADSLSDAVQTVHTQSGVTDDTLLTAVSNACHRDDLFNHVSSRFLREKYYENNFYYVVIKI